MRGCILACRPSSRYVLQRGGRDRRPTRSALLLGRWRSVQAGVPGCIPQTPRTEIMAEGRSENICCCSQRLVRVTCSRNVLAGARLRQHADLRQERVEAVVDGFALQLGSAVRLSCCQVRPRSSRSKAQDCRCRGTAPEARCTARLAYSPDCKVPNLDERAGHLLLQQAAGPHR